MNNSIKKNLPQCPMLQLSKNAKLTSSCVRVFYIDVDKSAISACRDDVARKNLEQDLGYEVFSIESCGL